MAGEAYFGVIKRANNTGTIGATPLASDADCVTGTSNSSSVTPTGLAATLGARTLNGIEYGRGLGVSLGATAAGTNGQLVIAATGAAPAFATATSSDSSITFATGANSLSIAQTFASGAEAIAGAVTTKSINPATLGSKLGTQTNHGVLVGAGSTAAVTALAVGTNGQVLLGSTGADPVFATLTSSDSTITFTTGAGSLSLQAAGGGMVWSVITGASQAMTKSNGYFSNRAGTVAFTLPASAAVGDTFAISNMAGSATGWSLAYNASQYIRFGNQTTTVTTGSLAATQTGDSIKLVCSVANTEFVVQSSIGNLTIV